MIKINKEDYDDFDIEVSWGKYDWKKEKGIAPFIKFETDKFCIGLEFRFSDVMFKETKLNIKTDITKYLTDITYDNEKGWISLIGGKYNCYITRIDENNFKIEMRVIDEYEEEKIDIELNEVVKVIG